MSVVCIVAMKLLSIPVGVADLEVAWRTTHLAMSSKRTRMDMNQTVKCVELKTDITLAHDEQNLVDEERRRSVMGEKQYIYKQF